LPSLNEIKNLMEKIAKKNGILEEVENILDHCNCVWKFSEKIAKSAIKNGYNIDLDFLKIACYVHDIGRMMCGSKASRELKSDIYHGMDGYNIIKKQGWSEKLARVCVRHMGGVGQPKDVNEQIGFGDQDTLAETNEEKILAYADCRVFYNKELGRADIESFEWAYNRFKIHSGVGELLKKNHDYIAKITNNEFA